MSMSEWENSSGISRLSAIAIIIVVVIVIGGAIYYIQTQKQKEIPVIRAGYVVPIENTISLFEVPYVQEHVLKDYGKKYKIELLRLQGTPMVINALAAGEIDVGLVAHVSFANAILQNVIPGGVRIIATDFYDAKPGYLSFAVVTPPGSGINTVKDLKGKKIAVNALGTAVHASVLAGLIKNGLSPDDVTFVEIPFPAMIEALKEGKADAAIMPAAFYWASINQGFKKVFDSTEGYEKPYPAIILIGRNDFLDKNPEAVKAFLADHERLRKYLQDPNNRDAVLDAAAEHFKVPKKNFAGYWFVREKDYYKPVDMRTDVEGLQYAVDKLYDLGIIKQRLDVSKYVDNSFLPSS